MSVLAGIAAAALSAAAITVGTATTAVAADDATSAEDVGAVFVQTNDRAENSVVAFSRAANGTLTRVGEFGTGGKGSFEQNVPLDALASQDSLTYDREHQLLFAVNAGSDTVTSFAVDGTRLVRQQIVPSGGQFPVSVTAQHGLVFVLNAGGAGNVTGYRLDGTGRLHAIPHSSRDLGLHNDARPDFISAPADIAITPDDQHVVVTTKNNGSLDVFGVNNGRLSAPVKNPSAGAVPFAVAFDAQHHLVVANASSTVSTYEVRDDGTLRTITAALPDNQAALCWITGAGNRFFGANAGSDTISEFVIDADGNASLAGSPDGVVAHTSGGPIDLDITDDGSQLFVQNALAGTVEAYRVTAGGQLNLVDVEEGLPQFDVAGGGAASGMEGLVAI